MFDPSEVMDLIEEVACESYDDKEIVPPFRASSLGSCTRQLARQAIEVKNCRSPNVKRRGLSKRMMDIGTLLGEQIAQQLRHAAPLDEWTVVCEAEHDCPLPIEGKEASEVQAAYSKYYGSTVRRLNVVNGKLCIPGHSDLYAVGNDAVHVYDFKWTGGWAYGKGDVRTSYKAQLRAYSEALRFKFPHHEVTTSLIVGNRDKCLMKVVPIDEADLYAPDVEQCFVDMANLLRTLAKGVLEAVPAPFFPDDQGKLPWQCNYCALGPDVAECFPTHEIANAKPPAIVPEWWAREK